MRQPDIGSPVEHFLNLYTVIKCMHYLKKTFKINLFQYILILLCIGIYIINLIMDAILKAYTILIIHIIQFFLVIYIASKVLLRRAVERVV